MRVIIDRNLCIGIGNCVAIAPTVFQLDAEGKAIALDTSSIDENTVLEAAKSCPVIAIMVEDDAGHQLYP